MKYLKLFEAFNSKLLSKTLSYIKNKSEFKKELFKILENIDFPESDISDEYFNYYRFKKGLYLNKENLVKFYFNSDGIYIGASIYKHEDMNNIIGDISDYNINDKKTIDHLKNKSTVLMNIRGDISSLCKVYKFNGIMYAFQNDYKENEDHERYLYYISKELGFNGGNYNVTKNKNNVKYFNELEFKKYELVKYKNREIPYLSGDINYMERISQNFIKDADFIITLDINLLQQSDYNKKSNLVYNRNQNKPNVSDKNKNMDSIIKIADIASGVIYHKSLINYSIIRFTGDKYILFYIIASMNTVTDFLLDIGNTFNDNQSDGRKEMLKKTLKDRLYYTIRSRMNIKLPDKVFNTKKELTDNNLKKFNAILSLNNTLYYYLKNVKIENQDDLTKVRMAFYTLSEIVPNSIKEIIRVFIRINRVDEIFDVTKDILTNVEMEKIQDVDKKIKEMFSRSFKIK